MPSDDTAPNESDDAGLTERQVYDAVHRAVRDALWDVLGTVVLTLFLVVVALSGVQILRNSRHAASGTEPLVAAFGVLVAALGAFGLLRLYDDA